MKGDELCPDHGKGVQGLKSGDVCSSGTVGGRLEDGVIRYVWVHTLNVLFIV